MTVRKQFAVTQIKNKFNRMVARGLGTMLDIWSEHPTLGRIVSIYRPSIPRIVGNAKKKRGLE